MNAPALDAKLLRDYRSDRGVFLSARARRHRIEKGGFGSWSGARRNEVEAFHSALGLRNKLGLATANPDRFVIP